jgi:hypothetical protein
MCAIRAGYIAGATGEKKTRAIVVVEWAFINALAIALLDRLVLRWQLAMKQQVE